MFYPQDTMKIWWDATISLILLVSCFTAPYNLAFDHAQYDVVVYRTLLDAMDILFLLDIFVQFNSALENENYQIIDKRKEISSIYLKGWFLVDAIAILRFDWFINTQDSDNDSTGNMNKIIRFTRIGKLYKLVKIVRLIRLIKVIKLQGQILGKIQELFNLG